MKLTCQSSSKNFCFKFGEAMHQTYRSEVLDMERFISFRQEGDKGSKFLKRQPQAAETAAMMSFLIRDPTHLIETTCKTVMTRYYSFTSVLLRSCLIDNKRCHGIHVVARLSFDQKHPCPSMDIRWTDIYFASIAACVTKTCSNC
jgi:hypothetical protein